jgi:hypothetical protein
MQWAINACLLALAALFAFGGRLADTVGHRRMVVLGVVIFAGASALCGLTPAGGYLLEWTWRAIFWINVPVALIALALIAISRLANESRPARMDYRGLALIVAGIGLSVFGLQQSSLWGWGDPVIEICIIAGVLLLVVFVAVERNTEPPLINVRIFANRAFAVENVILFIAMMAFIPVFFYASVYGQIALAEKATTASLLILYSRPDLIRQCRPPALEQRRRGGLGKRADLVHGQPPALEEPLFPGSGHRGESDARSRQPPRHEPERHRARPVQPRQVVHHKQHGVGHGRRQQEGTDGARQDRLIRRGFVAFPERGVDRTLM